MHGHWWSYHAAARSRQAAQSQRFRNADYHDVAFDRADDLWIFVRLGLVLAAFFVGVAGILWIAS